MRTNKSGATRGAGRVGDGRAREGQSRGEARQPTLAKSDLGEKEKRNGTMHSALPAVTAWPRTVGEVQKGLLGFFWQRHDVVDGVRLGGGRVVLAPHHLPLRDPLLGKQAAAAALGRPRQANLGVQARRAGFLQDDNAIALGSRGSLVLRAQRRGSRPNTDTAAGKMTRSAFIFSSSGQPARTAACTHVASRARRAIPPALTTHKQRTARAA